MPSTSPTVQPVEAAIAVAMSHLLLLSARAEARRSARSVRTPTTCRLYSADPRWSVTGAHAAARPARRRGRRARPTAARRRAPPRPRRDVMSPPAAASAMPGARDRAVRELERRARGDHGPVADAAVDLLVGAARARRAAGRGSRSASRPGRPRSRTGRGGTRACRRRARRRAPRMTICAPTAAQTADRSSDGSAWQSAPPIVPRLRTTGSAITRSASVKIASRRARSARLEQRAVARHRADPDLAVVLLDVAELVGQRIDVDHVARAPRGAASSSAAGEWPPASRRASGPSCLEQRERLLDARRALVAERCWDLQDRLLVSPRATPCRCYGRAVNPT